MPLQLSRYNDVVFCLLFSGSRAGRRLAVAFIKGLQLSGVAVIAS